VSRVLTTPRAHVVGARGTRSLRFVVACALALAALGGGSAVAASDDSARLPAIRRLSPAQFVAIEGVYVAALPFDRFRTSETAPQSKYDAATKAVLRACGKLSTRDPLLRALRAGCPATSELNKATAALAACSDAACVRRAIRAARAALRRGISGGRVSDRAVNATHLAPRCKRALVTPPGGYTAFDELDAALGKLDRALATGSPDALAAAQTALARAEKKANRLPTAKRSLQLLRTGCR
jgi:hypothetical protein